MGVPRSSRASETEEPRAAELSRWAVSRGTSVWLIDLEPYESCRVVGIVERLRIDPRKGHIEAEITDGTDVLVARWSIRRPTPELAVVPGRAVVLEGVAGVGDDGRLILEEPGFETIPWPGVG